MVDENELAGKLSPQQVFEHINVGCDLIEKAPENHGPRRHLGRVSSGHRIKVCLSGDRASGQNHSRQYPLRGGAGITKQKIVVSYNILAQLSPLRDTRQFWTTGL